MPLGDYEEYSFTHAGKARSVFRRGSGPAVVIMAEIPGITPKVVEFADRVVDIGCTAVVPHLFGAPGAAPTVRGAMGVVAWGTCVSREFTVWATGRTSPVIAWLRALGAHEHERCGGPGIGAVGMCFTGGFALGMMVDDHLLAPVLSQPSVPYSFTRKQRRDLGLSPDDLARVKERAEEGCQVLGLRFTGDRMAPGARFRRLEEELGDAFVGVEIDSSRGNPWGFPRVAHSVLTEHLVDEPGNPTSDALDQVLDLFRTRLLESGPRK
jgi:dienelactone hydrolase